jgi:hypothetical protein
MGFGGAQALLGLVWDEHRFLDGGGRTPRPEAREQPPQV